MFDEVLKTLLMSTVPTVAVSAIVTYTVNNQLKKIKDDIDKRDDARAEEKLLTVKGTVASIELGAATAKELFDKGHIDNNTSEALKYALDVKHDIEDFYTQKGVEQMNKG